MPQLLETLKDVAVKGKIIVCQQCKRIRLKDGVQTDCGDFKTPAKWSHPVPGLLPEIEKVYTVVKTVCCKCTTGGMQ